MKRFKDILYVVETGEACETALERAVTLAEHNLANLTVVGVVENVASGVEMVEEAPVATELQTAIVGAHGQGLESLVKPYRKRIEIQTKVLAGTPFLEIIREVFSNGHDLVVKSPKPRIWQDRLFSSEDMHLLRKCPCPVWIIKPTLPKPYQVILAAIDVNDAYPPAELKSRYALNLQILEMASSLALSDFANLHIVQVWRAVGENTMRGAFLTTPEKQITAYVEQTRQKHEANFSVLMDEVTGKLGLETLDYLKFTTHLVKGFPRKEIPAIAKQIEADLVVMGTVGRTGISGFIMGNTAETILSQIDCSVLAIKPPGFITPVALGG